MRQSTIARALLVLGTLVGCAAGVALALGVGVDDIPSWMITVGMYKLAFIAAGGLLVVGALLGRAATSGRTLPNDSESGRPAVGPGSWEEADHPPRKSARVERNRTDNST
jgi:hypothetical protein